MKSTSVPHAHATAARSTSVIASTPSVTPGTLTPLWLVRTARRTTTRVMTAPRAGSVATTSSSILPSSMRTRSPGDRSSARLAYVMHAWVASPTHCSAPRSNARAGDELGAFGHLPHADLGTRQVDEDADVAAELLGGGAHGAKPRVELGGAGVGGVEAHDVDAGSEQRLEHFGRIGRRTECGDDSGAAHERPPLGDSDSHLETTPDSSITRAWSSQAARPRWGTGANERGRRVRRYSIGLGSRTI